jgi:hypothetical protein
MPARRLRPESEAGPEREQAGAASPPHLSPDTARVLELQQSMGNAAVARMLQPNTLQRVKSTEKEAIKAGDQGLTDEDADALVEKTNTKGQSFERAREIAAKVEAESEALVSGLPATDAADVRKAIKNYVADSAPIQTSARESDPDEGIANVKMLSAALELIRAQMTEKQKKRIVYRSITYGSVAEIPYGRTDADPKIKEGDVVGDNGFLSTSEHRQFVLGKTQTGAIGGLLRLVIHSKAGVPIAIDFADQGYSNRRAKAVYDMFGPKKKLDLAWRKVFGKGPEAGQAEVLFARDSQFIVKKIDRSATGVTAVLEDCTDDDAAPVNMKTGQPL